MVITLIVVHPALRALARSTGRAMTNIHPAYLAFIVAINVMQALFAALIWRNALLSVNRWHGAKSLLRYRNRFSAGVQPLAKHKRALWRPSRNSKG